MFHLDNNSGVSAMPPVGTVQSSAPRWFTEGGGGTPASYPGAAWYNIIQAELLNFLSAYGIAPDKEQFNQLQVAIEEAISQKATAASPLLAAIAALVTSANKMPYFTGKDKVAMTDLTAFARTLLSRSDADGVLSDLRLVTNGFVGRLVNVITISSSTTYTPTEGVKKIIIEACGGGGGGGAAMATAASQSSVGTGGAAADYVRTSLIEAKPLQITIGSGGSGGNGTSSAAPGGATTVGDIISCRGGPGGAAGVASSTPITSNTGGGFTGSLTAPTDSVIVNGGLGIRGFIVNPGSASGQVAGTGGSTPLGRGADGQQAAAGNPAPENNYGCGGAGGANQGSSAIKFGGDGMSGVVIIREYA